VRIETIQGLLHQGTENVLHSGESSSEDLNPTPEAPGLKALHSGEGSSED
jgi:hypothetical protein